MTTEVARIDAVLAGGGEMGRLMRSLEWSTTAVGPIEHWPQSLRTSLSILLASGYPMYIAWGPHFVQFYNDAYRPILGSTKHPAALGRSTTETFAEIWDFIGPMFEGVLRDGMTSTYADQLLPMDRHGYLEECYFDFSYSPVRAESGEVGGIFVTCTETTGRVLGERRLRTLRDLAASASDAHTAEQACAAAAAVLANNLADLPFVALYLLDPDTQLARLVGSAGLEPGGPASPLEMELGTASVWPCAEVAESGTATIVDAAEVPGGVLPGGPWPEAARAAFVLPIAQAGQEHPAGLLVAGISPRRALDDDYRSFFELVAGQIATAIADARAYQAERQRAEALAELDRAKTTFFSNVSHEFRTPLSLLLGPVEDALADADEPLAPIHRERLEVAHRNGLRLLKLVNTLLDFARIEAGRVQAVFEPTDLSSLTTELGSVFRSAIERAGLRFVVDCPTLNDPMYVDADMWEKIVLNLLSNAFKFTLAGEIALRLRDLGERVELVVRDTGVGIPPEELPRVFERFHRVKTSHARTFEGTGIGLALVQELVKLHGGDIRVESTPGVGTTFVVALRKGAAHLDPSRIGGLRSQASSALGAAPYLHEALRWLPEQAAPGLEPWMPAFEVLPRQRRVANDGEAVQPARILVADDNADMRNYVRRLLATNYEVVAVSDGIAALEIARTQGLDLVLADVMMPGLDGFGLLRALRADPTSALLPIVLLSARAGEEAKVEGLEAGADDYLVKPFAARELLARVDAHLALARARDAAARREQAARAEAEAERQRLLDVFMQAPAAICLLQGPEHTFLLANPLYQRLVGKTADQLVGKPLLEALPEVAEQPFVGMLDGVRTTAERFIGNEARVLLDRRADGRLDEAYVNFVYEPLRDLNGDVEYIFVHAVEVTDLVHARQAARDDAQLVETLHRVGSVLAAELDLDRLVQSVTDAATEATGAQFGAFFYNRIDERGESYTLYTISGVPREHFSQFPMPRNTAIFAPTFSGRGVVRLDDVQQDPRYGRNAPHNGMPQGHLPVRSYLAVPVKSRSGEVLGGLFFGHEHAGVFTERAERLAVGIAAQAAIALDNARLYQQVQRAVQTRDEFLAAAAHDLKTPLASMKGIAQLLHNRIRRLELADGERLTDGLARIDATATRMAILVNELLDLARLEMERPLELERQSTDLVALAQQAVADQQPNSPRHRLVVETAHADLVGNWDESRIRRVIDNLLSNAVKYSPAGGDVIVILKRQGDLAVVEVSDSGVGIPADDLSHIFERFRRGSNVGQIQGTGIGLAISRMIVEQHGGSISAHSSETAGTTFAVRLPVS